MRNDKPFSRDDFDLENNDATQYYKNSPQNDDIPLNKFDATPQRTLENENRFNTTGSVSKSRNFFVGRNELLDIPGFHFNARKYIFILLLLYIVNSNYLKAFWICLEPTISFSSS